MVQFMLPSTKRTSGKRFASSRKMSAMFVSMNWCMQELKTKQMGGYFPSRSYRCRSRSDTPSMKRGSMRERIQSSSSTTTSENRVPRPPNSAADRETPRRQLSGQT